MNCCAGVTCCVASSDLMVLSITGSSGLAWGMRPKASTSPAQQQQQQDINSEVKLGQDQDAGSGSLLG